MTDAALDRIDPMIRLKEVRASLGLSESTFYEHVSAGLCSQPIRVSARASALPASEVSAINRARVAGRSDDQIRALVRRLHAARDNAEPVPIDNGETNEVWLHRWDGVDLETEHARARMRFHDRVNSAVDWETEHVREIEYDESVLRMFGAPVLTAAD